MNCKNEMPWTKIHAFLLHCGSIRNPREFCVQIIREMRVLIPYDQARIYFVNDNGIVYDEILFGVDKSMTRAYHEYYSQVENGRYALFSKATKNGRYFYPKAENRVRDWTKCEYDEFIADYLKPQGILYSFGFSLHDIHNSVKIVGILDRIHYPKFTNKEINIMKIILAHLDNLHKNFYVNVSDYDSVNNQIKSQTALTIREAEIAELLIKGVTPANVSKKLCICQSTVYKHITHIHTKLNVSNRQELLVKLLNMKIS